MIHPAEKWVIAFAWTLWIEVPLYLIALRHTKIDFAQAFTIAIAVNVFTHPALWYIFPRFDIVGGWWTWLVIAEACVSLVEGLVIGLAIDHLQKGVIIALVVNMLSTTWGLLFL